MKKKIIVFLLIAVIAIAMTGCGCGRKIDNPDTDPTITASPDINKNTDNTAQDITDPTPNTEPTNAPNRPSSGQTNVQGQDPEEPVPDPEAPTFDAVFVKESTSQTDWEVFIAVTGEGSLKELSMNNIEELVYATSGNKLEIKILVEKYNTSGIQDGYHYYTGVYEIGNMTEAEIESFVRNESEKFLHRITGDQK